MTQFFSAPLESLPDDDAVYNPLFNVGNLFHRTIHTVERSAWIWDIAWKDQCVWMLHLVAGRGDGGVSGIQQILAAFLNKRSDISASLITWSEQAEYEWRYNGQSYYREQVKVGSKWVSRVFRQDLRLDPDQFRRKYAGKGGKKVGGYTVLTNPIHVGDVQAYEGWILPRSSFVSNADPEFLLLLPKAWSKAERMMQFHHQLVRRCPMPFLVPEWAPALWGLMTESTDGPDAMIKQIDSFGHFDAYLCKFNQERIIQWISTQVGIGSLTVPGYEDLNPRHEWAA